MIKELLDGCKRYHTASNWVLYQFWSGDLWEGNAIWFYVCLWRVLILLCLVLFLWVALFAQSLLWLHHFQWPHPEALFISSQCNHAPQRSSWCLHLSLLGPQEREPGCTHWTRGSPHQLYLGKLGDGGLTLWLLEMGKDFPKGSAEKNGDFVKIIDISRCTLQKSGLTTVKHAMGWKFSEKTRAPSYARQMLTNFIQWMRAWMNEWWILVLLKAWGWNRAAIED